MVTFDQFEFDEFGFDQLKFDELEFDEFSIRWIRIFLTEKFSLASTSASATTPPSF